MVLSVALLTGRAVDCTFVSLVSVAVAIVGVIASGDDGGAGWMCSAMSSSESESKLSSRSLVKLFGSTHTTVDASLSYPPSSSGSVLVVVQGAPLTVTPSTKGSHSDEGAT